MRFLITSLLLIMLQTACVFSHPDDVWSEYDWLPADSEGNLYGNDYGMGNGGYGGPYYDNDSDYQQPSGAFCSPGSGTIGCE